MRQRQPVSGDYLQIDTSPHRHFDTSYLPFNVRNDESNPNRVPLHEASAGIYCSWSFLRHSSASSPSNPLHKRESQLSRDIVCFFSGMDYFFSYRAPGVSFVYYLGAFLFLLTMAASTITLFSRHHFFCSNIISCCFCFFLVILAFKERVHGI